MDLIADLLKASLLESLGDDAERADKLRAAATTLGSRLVGDERGLTPHVLLAAVSSDSANSSALELAYELLVGEWETLANAYPERPVELLRAVLLGGVAAAAESSPQVRLAAWYTLRSALEQGAGGRWNVVLDELLHDWSISVDKEIEALWRPDAASSALRMPSLSEPDAFTMKSRAEVLSRAEQLQASTNWQTFATELQPSYAQDVTRVVELAEGAGLAGGKRAVGEVKKALSELGGKLREALELHEQGLEAVRLRGDLLWWQQSRYSPTLQQAYGELDSVAEVVVAAAVDLSELVPGATPVAAEHLLARLVGSVTEAQGVGVAELRQASAAGQLPRSCETMTPSTLLSAITSSGAAAVAPALRATEAIRPDRASVLLFRDLQAAAALAPRTVAG